MKVLYRIMNLSKYTVYALVVAAILVPLIRPLGIPVKVTQDTINFYSELEKLQPNDVVLFDINFALAAASELVPQITAISHHLVERGAKCLVVSTHPEAYPFALTMVEEWKKLGSTYGEDMVYLGFVPGDELAVASILTDLHQTAPNDYEGVPLSSLPLAARLKSGADLTAVVSINTNASGPDYWTRQAKPFPNITLLLASQASLKANIQMYISTGQIKASLNGSRCTAEYELLLEKPGKALAMMDATSSVFGVFLLFVVFGNIVQYLRPRMTQGGKGAAR